MLKVCWDHQTILIPTSRVVATYLWDALNILKVWKCIVFHVTFPIQERLILLSSKMRVTRRQGKESSRLNDLDINWVLGNVKFWTCVKTTAGIGNVLVRNALKLHLCGGRYYANGILNKIKLHSSDLRCVTEEIQKLASKYCSEHEKWVLTNASVWDRTVSSSSNEKILTGGIPWWNILWVSRKGPNPPSMGRRCPGNVHYLRINKHGERMERNLIIENGLE